jgi:iron(III) transport system substrate-binding protein
MKKRSLVAFTLIAALFVSVMAAMVPAQARDLKGSQCGREGQIRTISGITYTCERVGGKLQYAEGRKLSGTLNVVCGATETWCAAMAKRFKELTGVETKFVRLSAGLVPARLEAFKNNPEFDVWHGGPADGYVVGRNSVLTEAYLSPTRKMIPSKYLDDKGFWSGVYLGALGFCSNTQALAKLGVKQPKSWADLLNPKLKGQVLSAHPSTSGTAFTTFWTQVTRLGSEDKAMDYMKELHKNILYYSRSGVAPVGAAGSGEVAVGLVFAHDCIAGIQNGLPLKNSFPSEGTGYEIGGVALVKGAKNPLAAKTFIDFALSADAQNLGVGAQAYQALTNPQAKYNRLIIPLSKVNLVDYDFEKAGNRKPDLTKRFDDEIINRTQVRG